MRPWFSLGDLLSTRNHPSQPGISVDAAAIQSMIEAALPGAEVRVSGADGVHFEASVVSPAFAGKPPLARHRLVYAALGERMGGEIHALSLKTHTPEEAAHGKDRN